MFDFRSKGDDLLFLFGTGTPSTEEEETIVFVLALIHEYLWFASPTVLFPVLVSVFNEILEFLTVCSCVCLEQVIEEVMSGFSARTEGHQLVLDIFVEVIYVALGRGLHICIL
jgi:hypothetical protein